MPFARFLRGRTSLATDVFHSVGGAVFSRVITAASLPILTHIYAPIDFGVWPLLLAFSGFLLPLATLRYDIAIVLAKSRRVAVSLVWVILIATALVSTISLLALVLIGPRTASAVVGLGASYGA